MALLVLDTSVIMKWFVDEEFSEIAIKLKESFIKGIHEIVIPDIVIYNL